MKKYTIILLISSLVFTSAFYTTKQVVAASTAKIQSHIDKGSFLNPDFLTLDIMVSGDIGSFNATLSIINFDPNILQISEINYDNSFCEILAIDTIQNDIGQARIACGKPSMNKTNTVQIARITLEKLNAGWTSINFENSLVLSSDGFAENILNDIEIHKINILK